MKYLIIGSGAVGGYFGARLAQSGQDVSFLARGEHLSVIQQNGLTVNSIKGDFVISNVKVFSEQELVKGLESCTEKNDVIFVAVKSFQLASCLALLKQVSQSHTMIIPLLNGVEATAQLRAEFGDDRVIGGLAKIISFVKAPGIINHVGAEPHLSLGELSGEKSDRINALSEELKNAGISHGITGNIETALWRKYLFVAGWSVVASLARAPLGALREDEAVRKLLQQSLEEFYQIAIAEKVSLKTNVIEQTMQFLDELPAHSETSLQRDLRDNKMSELDGLLGYASQLASKHQLDCHLLTNAYACLAVQQKQALMS